MGFLFFVLVLVGWLILYSRLRRAEDRLNDEQYARARDGERIAELTRRIWTLEKSQTATASSRADATPVEMLAQGPAPEPPPYSEPFEPPAPVVFEPPSVVVPPLDQPPAPVPVFAVPEPFRDPAPPQRTWRDQLRDSMGGQEWEAVVGGSWLNKLGVLVLVIGIALLLGYEFARVGPAGRVAIGMGTGLTMLMAGVFIERKSAYAIFARGLIGGGWAALYFTTYAMHALPAAKVIDNPYAGTALLLAAACGMILHSLRYRSQTVSGLAYFIAFATLALSESTPFSVLALLPLAGSLLYLAHRFEWHQMAVFGLFATYATVASRPDAGAPLASTQALFAAYWLLFETFDLLRLRRSTAAWTIESFILPINALGFLTLSIVKWQRSAPEHLYAFFAAGAILYLAGALLRVSLRPPSTFGENSGTLARIAGGSYEGPITLSAALAAGAILLRATGEWINLGLLMEGEILFLVGLRFGQRYLRQLAGAAFTGLVMKLVVVDESAAGSIVFAGRSWTNWSPIASLTAAVFYVNRMLRVPEGVLFSSAAAGLLAMVLGYETPHQYLCVSWLAYAALLFELGFRFRQQEFRYQAYLIGALGTCAGLLLNALGITAFGARADWQLAWLPLAISAAIHYTVTLRVALSRSDRLSENEAKVSWITAISATSFLFAIAWKLAPGDYLGAAWLLLGALLFELGLRGLPKHFRWLSYFVSAAGLWNMFWVHVVDAQIGSNVSEAISLGIATVVCWSVSARVFRAMPDRIGDWEREWCRDLYAAYGALFAMTLVWLKLPGQVVAPVWTALGIVTLEIGVRFALSRFRLLAHIVATAVCVRLLVFDFAEFGDALHITYRTFTVIPILASHYYIWSRCRRASIIPEWERAFSRLYLYLAFGLATFLARLELGQTWAVVAWALFGLALYQAGLLRDIADLRWQSYALALLAFWRSWTTNFSRSDTLAGIHARVLTGAVVIASFYCAQLLSPRDTGVAPGFERYARAFYSLLASLLLAVLLFYEVSGGMLTMVWGMAALVLLGAGFPLRDRVQRLSGLALFMICVLKLFLYDLRELETVNRILSFIVLGLILVGVSWIYTRFRDRIQRYL
jgi:uncharacterized membrane protein